MREKLDTEIKIDVKGLEKEEVEKLREEESENDKEESSKRNKGEKEKERYHQVTEDNRGYNKRRRDQAICRKGV